MAVGIKTLDPAKHKELEENIERCAGDILEFMNEIDGSYQEHMNALLRVVSSMALAMGTPKEHIVDSIHLLYDSYALSYSPEDFDGVIH